MTMKTYRGSCHCGAVRFEAEIDLSAGTNRCNCSICFKSRIWFAFAKGASAFRLLSGADHITDYRWVPPERAESFLTFSFCKTCGIRVFARGELEALGGVFHAVPVVTPDDADADELAAAPVNFIDGRHNHFDRPPADTRLL